MEHGVTFKTFGIVEAVNVGRLKEVVIKFDQQPFKNGELPWYSEASEIIPFGDSNQKQNIKIGTRVVLEYITSPSSGLWWARLPQPKEIQEPRCGHED